MTVDGSVRMTETSCRALNPLITRHSSLVTTVPTHGSAIKSDDPTRIVALSDRRESKGLSRSLLIYGSAIKSHRKPWRFNYLQFSNRR